MDIALLHVNNFRTESWSGTADAVLRALSGAGLVAGFFGLVSGRRGPAGRLAMMWLVLSILLGGLSPGWHSHYFRYQIPPIPLATLAMVSGWSLLTAWLPGAWRRSVRVTLSALLLFVLWPGAGHMRDLYGRNCANIHEQQTKVGRWIEANTPPATRVALNDAGAIAYYGNRSILDLVGLTTHGWAAANRSGAGAIYEKLESLPARDRPQIMAIYPQWYPQLVATSLAGQVLFSADLRDNTICGDRLKQVYRIDWSIAGSGALPVERQPLIRDFGMTIVDQVDVADFDSEASHGYSFFPTYRDRLREFVTREVDGPAAADGGRMVGGGESMSVRARPGQWLIMVMRTETEAGYDLDVSVNGKPAGSLTADRLALTWTEPLLQIPDSLVVDSLLTVDVRLRADGRRDGYASYHYWFLQ
jgi:hypothetical protein